MNNKSNDNLSNITTNLESFKKNLESLVTNILPEKFNFKEHYKTFQESILILAENNWYPDLNMSLSEIIFVGQSFQDGRIKEADSFLVSYFDKEINTLTEHICRNFPDRLKVIESAVDAHKNKKYYLSIPVFYSQAEGISEQLLNLRFFKTRNKVPVTSSFAESYEGTELMIDFLKPLTILSSNRQIQDLSNPIGINRHDVLHGASVDYGEYPLNSYKAFSLLNYVSELIHL